MKSKIIKATIFVLIFCIILSGISFLVVQVDPEGYPNISEFYDQPEESLDAVYIGSSNCFTFWNPLFAWNEYGISVYPYSCNANPYFATKYLVEEARKTQPNATFIVNLNSITDGELTDLHMHNIIDSMPFSRTKLEMIDHLCDVGGFEGTDRAEFYFPFLRFHSRWPYFTFNTKFSLSENGYKAACILPDYLQNSEDVAPLYVAPEKTVDLLDVITSSTDSLLDYCGEENISILFVVVPQAREDVYEADRLQTLADYVSSKGYPVLNLMENSEEEFNLNMTKDYYNGPHTNIHGSIKYTYYLSEYLIENYGFEDKRNNEEYAHWHTSYENYMKVASEHILDIELDYEHRDFSIEEPVFEVESKDNSAVITWDSVKDADGYAIYKKSSSSPAWECLTEVSAQSNELQYTDKNLENETTYYYTIVPFVAKDNESFYGDFNYTGIPITVEAE